MKKITLLLLFFYSKNLLLAQESRFPSDTHIYLVRHAEKEAGKDPELTEAGKKRAGDLMRVLKDKHISHIYVTRTRRSGMTGDSIHLQLGIDTVHYDYDTTGKDLIVKIEAKHDFGKTILVIGHSNTIPQIIKALGSNDYPYPGQDIPDNEFDNIYQVVYMKGSVFLEALKYGDKSGSSGTMKNGQ